MQAIHKKTSKKIRNRAGRFLKLLGVIFAGGSMIFGALSVPAFATESSVNFSVVVPEVDALEISLSASNLTLNLTPQMAEASFGSKDLTITVGTSNIAGYNLMMNTSDTALTSANNNTIESLEENENGYTCTDVSCDFTVNHWGFKKSSETAYNHVPSSVSLVSNGAATNGESTTINFASRVDAQQPAGTYSTTLTFVATANPVSISNISQIEHLQDFANLTADEYGDVLSSMETGTAYEKSDDRDNKTYSIAKLADGNIWFLDNLRLDPTAQTLTSANTNVTSTPSITFTNKTSGWTGTTGYTEAWYNLDSEDSTQSYGSGSNGIGGYYNYCAASAGSYCMNSSSGSGNASQDLCPAGWRMPTGGIGGEYATLAQAITGTSGNLFGTDRTDFMNAAHIALSGGFWGTSANYQGSRSYLWSSTFYSTSDMYYLYLGESAVNLTDGHNRVVGFSIRCVARLGSEMQKSTSATLANKLKNVNDVTTLVDSRDYQPYTVAKLADNKIWMTKNLNLPGGTEIESTKSDVPANYTLPTANGFQSGNRLPASSADFWGNTEANIYNSNATTCGSGSPCYSYYSWTAATAGSGLGVTADGASAPYSICPKGWKMPSTYNSTDSTAANYDFRALMIAYGGSNSVPNYTSSTTPTGATMYERISANPVPNFLLTGYYIGESFVDDAGSYWSATSKDAELVWGLTFGSTVVNSADNASRWYGSAVRCLLAN